MGSFAVMFIPGVMAIKMSKMAHFLYFLLMAAKNQSLKDLTEFFQKILELIDLKVAVREILID